MRPESSDFVGLYQGALDAALCDELVRRFAADPRVQRGQIGHGVDLAKKDSHDLTISHHRDWDDLSRRVAQATLPCLVDYARTYPSETARAATYADWIHSYNHHRPHTGIGGDVPAARVHNLTGNYS